MSRQSDTGVKFNEAKLTFEANIVVRSKLIHREIGHHSGKRLFDVRPSAVCDAATIVEGEACGGRHVDVGK